MAHKTLQIDDRHKKFLENHPEVNFSALARQALDHRMALQKELDRLSFSGAIRDVQDDILFRARVDPQNAEQDSNRENNADGEMPVTIEIKPNTQREDNE